MNDPTGVQSALGIEAVELFTEGGDLLTVRVTGRWRRRRPAWSGQPTLVLDAGGVRHRFPAMPEPPSLTGAVPGTWRMSFSVPASLAPELSGRTWLQFGAVVVPLPAAVEPSGLAGSDALSPPPDSQPPQAEPQLGAEALAARRVRSSELAAESARRRAAEADAAAGDLAARIEEFARQLDAARGDSERLSAALAKRERARRAAEQRAHAEHALRLDLEQELAARERESTVARQALGELAAAEERVRELEREYEPLRRRADEAEQLARTAVAARERAERRAAELAVPAEIASPSPSAAGPGEAHNLSLERALIAQHASVTPRRPSEPPLRRAPEVPVAPAGPGAPVAPPGAPAEPSGAAAGPGAPGAPGAPAASPEPTVVGERAIGGDEVGPTIEALRRELERRASAEALLRAQIVTVEGRLQARVSIENEISDTLAQLRGELDGLRSALERESAAVARAQRRAAELARELSEQRARAQLACEAIGDLRRALAEPPATVSAVAAPPTPDPAGPVEPERLSQAFSRLRETTVPEPPPAEVPGAEPPGRAWLAPVFTALARQDAASAGRLLLDLLPAQRAAYPHAVAYDLVLGQESGVVQVTVRDGAPEISHTDAARPSSTVDFEVLGSPASIARRLTARGLRRRFGRRVARVRGDRGAFAALRALVEAPLRLSQLHAAGVRLAPPMALNVVSLMIDPAWTAGERFTVAYTDGDAGDASACLGVHDGRALTVAATTHAEPATTTIVCAADSLLLVLAGGRPDQLEVRGDERPLGLLLDWVQRAQSG